MMMTAVGQCADRSRDSENPVDRKRSGGLVA
ncbi:hypothetical protein JMJ77_0007762, partial [Colletotrichum scovillei]